jgi:hypothetical protein
MELKGLGQNRLKTGLGHSKNCRNPASVRARSSSGHPAPNSHLPATIFQLPSAISQIAGDSTRHFDGTADTTDIKCLPKFGYRRIWPSIGKLWNPI